MAEGEGPNLLGWAVAAVLGALLPVLAPALAELAEVEGDDDDAPTDAAAEAEDDEMDMDEEDFGEWW